VIATEIVPPIDLSLFASYKPLLLTDLSKKFVVAKILG
jgi:hypothetical protein